jgi:predicted GTPase
MQGSISKHEPRRTAAQIPHIEDRRYPASLAGDLYPDGIPIRPEEDLEALIAEHDVQECILSYSDLKHEAVMSLGSRVLAACSDFRLLGRRERCSARAVR